MNELKKAIVKYFVCCVFGISVAESIADSIFEDILFPIVLSRYGDEEYIVLFVTTVYLSSIFLIFFLGAYIFYRFSKKAMEEESKRLIKEQNLMYSCIAHDLKTPMTSVCGFASALRDGKIKLEEQGEILDIIYKKSYHMNELIQTLFMYSKLGTEEYKLNLKNANLCSIVRDVVAVNFSEFEDRNIELVIEIPKEPICYPLDEKEFRRALNNLIVNAYKHNIKGTNVLVKVHSKNGNAYVTVADNGEEISKEFAETMFQPFVCGNISRTSGNGSGLGLAISAAIVEKHGGRLYMDNDIKKYTKAFVIRLVQ